MTGPIGASPPAGDGARIHQLIGALLDQPEPERLDWLVRTLPDDPPLRAQLIAAISGDSRPERPAKVSLSFGAAGFTPSALPSNIGRYDVRERLGHGGMGILYLAVDPSLNRLVAVKLLRFNTDDMRKRFMREALAIARLDHRNIITIFDVGEHAGEPFIAMEYIAGKTLEELIRDRAPLAVTERIRLMADLCDGLWCAHKAGIIHRDVKPANVMVKHDGTLKIIDFGIARIVDSHMTHTGASIGTPNYMSPEQLKGRAAGPLSDVFSVGLVLYEFLSSQRAFPGEVQHVVATHILSAEPQPLTALVPGIHPDLVKIVTRALRKEPADRYQHLGEMGADLTGLLTRLESASPPTLPSGVGRRRLPKWLPPAAITTSVGGALVIASTLTSTWTPQPAVEPAVPFRTASELPAGPAPQPDSVATTSVSPVARPTAPPAPLPGAPQPVAHDGVASNVADRIASLKSEAGVLRRRRDYDPAIARYLDVLTLDPRDEKALADLAETRETKRRADEAVQRLAGFSSETPSVSPSSEAKRLVLVAQEALRVKDDAAAQTALEEAMRLDRSNEQARKLIVLLKPSADPN